MNSDVIKSLLTSMLVLIGGIFVQKGWFSQDAWNTLSNEIVTFVLTLIAICIIVYKALQHTDSNKLVAAANVDPLRVSVVVKPDADPKLVAVASDKSNPVKLG